MDAANRIKFGAAIPQVFIDTPVDMALVRDWIVRAEQLGFEDLWVQEGILGSFPSLEPVSLLCYAAALTSEVKLGSSVIIAPLRNPVQLAKSLGSLDQISQGRLIVGLGLGTQTNHYLPFGIDPDRRARRFVEVVEVMKALWTQPEAEYQGHFWQLEGTQMEPKPVQQPYPPVWFGGTNPNALKRAVRLGNGWMGAGSVSTTQFTEAAARVKQFLEESGRDPATFPISKRVYIAVDHDANRAEGRLRHLFQARYGSADRGSRVSVWGSTSDCLEQLAEIVSAGAQHLMFNTVFDDLEQLEILANDIIPNL